MQDVLAADAADDLAASIISMQDNPYADNAIDTVIYAGRPLCYWYSDLCRTTLMLLMLLKLWFMQDDPSSDLCRATLMLMMLLTLWFMEDNPYAGVIYAIDSADSCW